MKNNKGFTLVELLAVLMLLGLIVVISVPTINSSIKTAKERASRVQKEIIVNAAKNYAAEHPEDLKKGLNMVSIQNDLVAKNYIDGSNAESIVKSDYQDKCVYIRFNSLYNQYDYSIVDCSETVEEECFVFETETLAEEDYSVITGYKFDGVDGKSCSLDVIIPAKLGGLEVRKIADNAFKDGSKKLTSVAFVQAVYLEEIGASAFANNNISSLINIPSTLKSIGEYAFENNVIKELDLSPFNGDELTLATIGKYAFQGNHISTFDFSSLGLLSIIPEGLFQDNFLTSVDFTKLAGISTINQNAFKNNEIIKVNINGLSSLTTIGTDAFAENQISAVTIQNNNALKTIGVGSFRGNSILKLTLEGLPSLTTIGESAFENNLNISTVSLSNLNKLTTIGTGAFRNAGVYALNINNLSGTSIILGEEAFADNKISILDLSKSKLSKISANCFKNNSLKQVTLPSTATTLAHGAFYVSSESNSSLEKVYNPAKASIGWHYIFGANKKVISDAQVDGYFDVACVTAGTTAGYECKSTAVNPRYTVTIFNKLP